MTLVKSRFIGIALVVFSAASFGTLAIFGKYASQDGMDVITILFLRFSLAAITMSALLIARHESLPRGVILFQLIGMGAVGYVGQAYSYFTALESASPGLVALLLYLYPAFVTILSAVVLRERIGYIRMIALGLTLVGVALTVGPGGGETKGIVIAILAAVIYSIYIIVGTRVMKQVSAVQSSMVIFTSAGAVSGILMLFNGAHFPASNAGWGAMAAIVIVATVLPVVSFLAGLERVGATNAAMLSTLEPVVTILLAAWIFGDQLQPIALLGGGFILVAVLLLTRGELQQPNLNQQVTKNEN